MKLGSIILKPVITEKTYDLGAKGIYVFQVSMDANKNSVAKELKRMYDVDVISAKVIVVPGKKRRILGSRQTTKAANWKKVLVQLKKDQKIEIFPKE
jgi:ribosomal protein L23